MTVLSDLPIDRTAAAMAAAGVAVSLVSDDSALVPDDQLAVAVGTHAEVVQVVQLARRDEHVVG